MSTNEQDVKKKKDEEIKKLQKQLSDLSHSSRKLREEYEQRRNGIRSEENRLKAKIYDLIYEKK